MATSRLECTIARLHSMNHEEYANFLKKHTKSDNLPEFLKFADYGNHNGELKCISDFQVNEIVSKYGEYEQ